MRANTKLHEPTDGVSRSMPLYAPAGTTTRLRKLCFARMRWISWSLGAMKRAPPGEFAIVVKPGQPMPPPQSAAARRSCTIAGPSAALSM